VFDVQFELFQKQFLDDFLNFTSMKKDDVTEIEKKTDSTTSAVNSNDNDKGKVKPLNIVSSKPVCLTQKQFFFGNDPFYLLLRYFQVYLPPSV
jgi:hypothetical protein